MLTWCLCIATYNRAETLKRCVRFALAQGRPPAEVVIVDGSDDWERTHAWLLEELASRHPGIRWVYERAKVRSLTHQRNQALEHVESDVLFMIDDDSFLYPDAAAEVMRVYEADPDGRIAGVGMVLASKPPDELSSADPMSSASSTDGAQSSSPPPSAEQEPSARGLKSFVASRLVKALDIEHLLLPYDEEYPDREIPEAVLATGAVRCRYIHGMRMTYRREIIQRERFDEMLQRYAATEDLDASYRVSRHGALVTAPKARLFHAQDPSARLTRFTRTALGIMNLGVLYRLKGHDSTAMLRAYRNKVSQRIVVDVARDLSRSRFDLPCARADYYAMRTLDKIQTLGADELVAWYPHFQRDLIERNPK